jgi:hypothetical protein
VTASDVNSRLGEVIKVVLIEIPPHKNKIAPSGILRRSKAVHPGHPLIFQNLRLPELAPWEIEIRD